jgi:hypothetical protein
VRPAPITIFGRRQTLAGGIGKPGPAVVKNADQSNAQYSEDFIFFQSTNEPTLEIANEDGQVVVARVTAFQAANGLAGQRPMECHGQPEICQFFSSETGGFGGTDFFDQISRRADFLRRFGEQIAVDFGLPGVGDGQPLAHLGQLADHGADVNFGEFALHGTR